MCKLLRMKWTRAIPASLSLAVAAAGCAKPHPLDWAAGLAPGWQFMGGGGPPWSAGFAKPQFAPGPNGYRRGWVLTEFKERRPALSAGTLWEIDCATGRYRALTTILYAKRNMQGAELSREESAEWLTPIDHDHVLSDYACADTPKQRKVALNPGHGVRDPSVRPMRSRRHLNPEP